MKVYIITGEPFPNGMAAVSRIKCYARSIIEGGIDCEVIIFRRTEVYGFPVKNTLVKGIYNGVPYRYISNTTLRGRLRFFRFILDKLDILKTCQYLKNNINKGDVLFLYMGDYVNIALRFMKIAHRKCAFCVRDLCEFPYGTGAETSTAIHMRKVTIEKQFPQLDGVVSISDALLQLAKTKTLPSCKHIKVPIMVEFEQFVMKDHSSEALVPYIFHAGTLYQQKDGILGMVEAFGMAKHKISKEIKFILTGSIEQSSHPEEIKKIIRLYNIDESIEFVGFLLRDQVKEYLSKASLVISNRPKSKQDYYGFSTKVGEYLASGTPLIMTNWGEAVNWLENGKSAYITEPEDTQALADAIVRVFTYPEESRRIGLAGQEVCQMSFDYRNWSKPLILFLNQLGK